MTYPAYSALAILDFRLQKESTLKIYYFLLISTPFIVSVNRYLLHPQPNAAKKLQTIHLLNHFFS